MNVNMPVPYPGVVSMADAATLAVGTILPSASRAAATHTSGECSNLRWRGVQLIVDITDVGAGPGTVTAKIQVYDPVAAVWVDLPDATTAALNATGRTVLSVHPSLTDDANAEVSATLPVRWRVAAVVATNAVTFSISGCYLS